MKQTSIIPAALALFLFLLPGQGLCRMEPGTITVNAVGGGYFFEGDQNLTDSPMGGLGLSYAFAPNWAVEAFAMYGNFAVTYAGRRCNCSEKNTDVDGAAGWINLLYEMDVEGKVAPFFSLGAGGLFLEDDSAIKDKASFLGNLGGGLKFHILDRLWFRTELKYALTSPGPNNNAMALAGFDWQISP